MDIVPFTDGYKDRIRVLEERVRVLEMRLITQGATRGEHINGHILGGVNPLKPRKVVMVWVVVEVSLRVRACVEFVVSRETSVAVGFLRRT